MGHGTYIMAPLPAAEEPEEEEGDEDDGMLEEEEDMLAEEAVEKLDGVYCQSPPIIALWLLL